MDAITKLYLDTLVKRSPRTAMEKAKNIDAKSYFVSDKSIFIDTMNKINALNIKK